ncbi:MAG: YeeE/YedE family protein [Myxococcota bacterium]|nr:YeeE/YedE family protein [Myxococcota bacterium]
MTTAALLRALAGGALIGLAAALVLGLHGRIAGISGTLGRALDRDDGQGFRIPFLAGLIVTGVVVAMARPGALGVPIASPSVLAVAGLLVGLGTTLANGCTSGHGVCGISRGSPRSLIAVITFIATGMVTVAIVRGLGLGGPG